MTTNHPPRHERDDQSHEKADLENNKPRHKANKPSELKLPPRHLIFNLIFQRRIIGISRGPACLFITIHSEERAVANFQTRCIPDQRAHAHEQQYEHKRDLVPSICLVGISVQLYLALSTVVCHPNRQRGWARRMGHVRGCLPPPGHLDYRSETWILRKED